MDAMEKYMIRSNLSIFNFNIGEQKWETEIERATGIKAYVGNI